MPRKPKRPVLHTDATGEMTLVYPFSEEEYMKGIVAPKNRKYAGIDDVLVKQLNNLGPTKQGTKIVGTVNVQCHTETIQTNITTMSHV